MSLDFDLIVDGLWVGNCPRTRKDAALLADRGIGAVVNLQSEMDFTKKGIDWDALFAVYQGFDIAVYRRPMVDFDEVDIAGHLPAAVSLVDEAMQHVAPLKMGVYLHCNAGCERSPTTAVAWLCWYREMALVKALVLVREARDCKPYEAMLQAVSLARGLD